MDGREETLPFNMYKLGCKLGSCMSVDGSRDDMINLQGWPKDGPRFSFSEADLGWESEEKKAEAAGRAWDETWVGNDEEQLLELEEDESDGSVRALEDDSDDEPEDARGYLDFANFPVPDELSSDEEEGSEEGSEEGGEQGGEQGGEEESEDSEDDVPLAERKSKVARV